MPHPEDIKRLISNHTRRLQKLKEHQALTGSSVDPQILIEIEDTEVEIENLWTQLKEIEGRVGSTPQISGTNYSGIPGKSRRDNFFPQEENVDSKNIFRRPDVPPNWWRVS